MSMRPFTAFGSTLVLALAPAGPPPAAGETVQAPTRIAVFAFELEDASAAATYLGNTGNRAATMAEVGRAARLELTRSGRYSVIDASGVDISQIAATGLRNCGGCEAGLAFKLGAEQSLLGVVIKATQTDYYVLIQIRDARTGRLLDQQEATFAGSEQGWPSGARMLIRHQVLATPEGS